MVGKTPYSIQRSLVTRSPVILSPVDGCGGRGGHVGAEPAGQRGKLPERDRPTEGTHGNAEGNHHDALHLPRKFTHIIQ